MCGINGFLGSDKRLVSRMNRILHHRGPDQQGVYADTFATLGSTRLAILDLSEKGRMPMHDGTQQRWIVFNGEIYNFKDIRADLTKKGHRFKSDSDTEVILKAYKQWGPKCVEKLNGQFAFCIYDRRKKQLFLARDRLGINPLFYYHDGKNFAFSSEIKSLLLHPEIKREMDWNSLAAYLTLRYVPGQDTIISGIRKLPTGHTLLIDIKNPKKLTINRFWAPIWTKSGLTERDAAKKVLELLEDSVRMRMLADVPLGAFLSGGIDSTAMVALMAKHSELPVKTFSVGFDEASFSEVENSRLVADEIGTEHTEIEVALDSTAILPKVVWHVDDLMADPAALPTYVMSQETRKHVTVVLSGDGNDELHGGYFWHWLLNTGHAIGSFLPEQFKSAGSQGMKLLPDIPYIRRMGKLVLANTPTERLYSVLGIFTPEEQEKLLTDSAQENITWSPKGIMKPYAGENLPPLHQWMAYDLENWLPDDILVKSDRVSMAHSLEMRVPFLDHRYVELALSLPASMKMKGSTEKYLFKRAMKGIVPRSIIKRKKQGFGVPINDWLEAGLKHEAELVFKQSSLLNSEYFRKQRISRILSQHQTSRKIYKKQFWSLLTLALWHKIHIEDAIISPKRLSFDSLF